MNAAASLPAVDAPVVASSPPMVFIDGVPDERLGVVEYVAEAPLDERRAVLDAGEAARDVVTRRRWASAEVVVTQVQRLSDEQQRHVALVAGRIETVSQASAATREHRHLIVRDDWSVRLQRPLATVWWSAGDGALLAQNSGRMLPGLAGNRSAATFRFLGQDVHVLEQDGEAWTVGTALATLSAVAELELSLVALPGELRDAPLTQAVDLAAPIGDALRQVIEPYALTLQRESFMNGAARVERRAVRPSQYGRPVRVRWAQPGQPLGAALRVDSSRRAAAAERWVASAAGWRVESTFDLVGAWDPSLEGEPDSAYDRTASDDFATYANVYRYWAVNEDGRFTGQPYDRGPAFDLNALFERDDLRPQALPLLPCLTLDDVGESRPALVQISTDAGETWSQYAGRAQVMEHRAAVYLDDDTLPPEFLAAAKQGDARVRVTASLQSPRPVEAQRWRGNPFAGTRPPRLFNLHQAFRFERIDPGSIHHAAVAAGDLPAREADQRAALEAWLVQRMREGQWQSFAMEGHARVDLAGVWANLSVGDRLAHAGAPGQGVDEHREAVARSGVIVRSVRCRFDRGVTEVQVRF